MNYFDLWETDGASYLAATFKSPTEGIGERFPPLTSRGGQWSKERLLDELAPGGFQAVNRDRVLTEELLKRNVTGNELRLLLKRREPDPSGTVLLTIVSAHQVTRFLRVIREYLLTASGRGSSAEPMRRTSPMITAQTLVEARPTITL
jgi:hypothetical protein